MTRTMLTVGCFWSAVAKRSGDTAFRALATITNEKAVSPLRFATALQNAFSAFVRSLASCGPCWAALCLLTSVATVVVSLMPCAAADWPQFLGPNRNGVTTDTNMAKAWPKDGPPVLWQKAVGQGFSGPVVAKGKLILFHRVDDKETVDCLDALTGKQIWSVNYPTAYKDDFGFDEGPRATPAINGERVFAYGAEGMLTCWNFETGKKLWGVDCKQEFKAGKGFFGIACSPLVEGELVLLNVGGKEGASVVAFDVKTGEVQWKAGKDEASYSSPVAATIGGKRYALFLTRGRFTGFNPADGKVLFDFPWRPTIQASVSAATPLVIGDKVFVSASYGAGAALLQITDSSVRKIWSGDDILSNHYATSVYHDGFLYGFDGRQEYGCKLRCVEAATGKVKWSEDGLGAGTLSVVNEDLLILTEKGELILARASPEGFKRPDRAQILPFGVRAYPAIADGKYYARSKEKLVCVSLR